MNINTAEKDSPPPFFVTVIIPTYKDWHRLSLCFDSLSNQSYPSKYYEVIAVNNDPNDPAPNITLPDNFRILIEAKPGSYAARNKAISVAKGEIFAFTDSDCIPNSDWIEKAVENIINGAARIAGHVELFYRSEKLTYAEIFEKTFAFNQKENVVFGNSVTANMITWRKHFDTVGLFNETLMSGGDFEWSERAQTQGIPIKYVLEVVVKHPARWNMHQLKSKIKRTIGGAVNSPNFSEKHYLTWTIRGFIPPISIMLDIIEHKNLTTSEKFIVIIISYYLKLYTTIQKIKIRTGIAKPVRA